MREVALFIDLTVSDEEQTFFFQLKEKHFCYLLIKKIWILVLDC